jgi:hypothetical protein
VDTEGICIYGSKSYIPSSPKPQVDVELPLLSPTASWTEKMIHCQVPHDLTVHHDARFLAALLFPSFFFPVRAGGESIRNGGHPCAKHCEELKDHKEMVVWNYAVAVFAIAVKV